MKKKIKKNYSFVILVLVLFIFLVGVVVVFVNVSNKSDKIRDLYEKGSAVQDTTSKKSDINDSDLNSSDFNTSFLIESSGDYRIFLKAKNPQYKEGSEIFFVYSIENLGNKTLFIPKNIISGIEIRNSDGTFLGNYKSSEKLKILSNDFNIKPMQKVNSEFSIKADDFGLKSGSSISGSYYAINVYIGNLSSNRVIVRILK